MRLSIFLLCLALILEGCILYLDSAFRPPVPAQTERVAGSTAFPLLHNQPSLVSTPKSIQKTATALPAGYDPVSISTGEGSLLIAPAWRYDCSYIPNPEAEAFCEQRGGIPGFGDDLAYLGLRAKGRVALQNVLQVDQKDYTSCGEAAFVMDWNYQHPGWTLDLAAVEKAGLKIGAYFTSDHPGPGGYLGPSPSGMEAIGDFYAGLHQVPPPSVGNINLSFGNAYAELEAKGLLFSQLSAGDPVVIEVTNFIGNPSQKFNDSHYIIITGVDFDAGTVTYNDPYTGLNTSGRRSGYARSATWEAVWASWTNNRDHNPGERERSGRGWYMIVR